MSHLFQSLIGVGVLSLYLAAWNPLNAQAQRSSSVPLLSTKCVSPSVRSWTSKVDISIGREIVSSSLQLEPRYTDIPGLITCQVSPDFSHPFETLRMEFAIPDQKNYNYTVKVFLDNNLTKTQQVRPGELQTPLIDVKGIKNVAIEIQTNHSGGIGCCSLYFLKLSLERTPTSLID